MQKIIFCQTEERGEEHFQGQVGLAFNKVLITTFLFSLQECAAVCEEKISQKISQLAEELQKNEEKLSEALLSLMCF